MTGPSTNGSRGTAQLGAAAPYVGAATTAEQGRHARPLAVPAVTAAFLDLRRSGLAALAAVAAGVAGQSAWVAIDLLRLDGVSATALVRLAVAVVMFGAAVTLGLRVLRSGRELLAALRRWHGLAPRTPVPGREQLLGGPGVVRLVLAVVGVAWALGAIAIAVLNGTLGGYVGLGLAALGLGGAGALAAVGWWRARTILTGGSVGPSADAFAPAPYAAASGQGRGAAPAQQGPVDGQPTAPWLPSAAPAPAASRPSVGSAAPPGQQGLGRPAPRPGTSQSGLDPVDTWGPPTPSSRVRRAKARAEVAEADIDQTRMGTGRSSRDGVGVLLEDGTRLGEGLTLIGRDPQPQPGEEVDALVKVLHPTVSKTHAAVRLDAESVVVTDRSSTNGTTAVCPDGERRELSPWQDETIAAGSELLLGSYRIRVAPGD